jgi:hypothetical protein
LRDLLVADRIVFLVDKMPKGDTSVELVDDEAFAVLVASGFEVVQQTENRSVTAGGKRVKATMIVLRPSGENRGVTKSRQRDEDEDTGGPPSRGMIQVRDEYGNMRSVTPAQASMRAMTRALQNIGEPGHLGPARNHDLPGLSIISGELVAKAWDSGALAAKRGDPESASPFPSESIAHTKWLQGYHSLRKAADMAVSSAGLEEAYRLGRALAEDLKGSSAAVTCPYDRRNPCYERWCKGFTDGGGTIE